MFETLKKINQKPRLFEFYSAETLWNNQHTSKQMLKYHLNESLDMASRSKVFIESSVEWLVSKFKIQPGTLICDFGCGPGLYTTRFAERGAFVTGIDFSENSLQYAKETARKKNLEIEYILKNYLDFNTENRFDLITMIMCDFCALSSEQRKKLLSSFSNCLSNSGSIVLDVYSLKSYEQRQETSFFEHRQINSFWSENDYYGFVNTFKYDKEKVVLDKYTIVEADRNWEVFNWLQYYGLDSLKAEFAENGFRIEECYSDISGTLFNSDSAEFAIVAKKGI